MTSGELGNQTLISGSGIFTPQKFHNSNFVLSLKKKKEIQNQQPLLIETKSHNYCMLVIECRRASHHYKSLALCPTNCH